LQRNLARRVPASSGQTNSRARAGSRTIGCQRSSSIRPFSTSYCPTSKLIRTFNAHPRRRHRLSRIDHASFIFCFIWRWLSGPCVYPSSRTIGSGRKLRGGCAHIGSWARVFLFDKRGLGNEQPNQDHTVGLAMAHCSSFLSATLDSDLLGLPSGGTPITYALHTFWRCVFAAHPVC
jgi:hypothetical protein